MCKSNDNYVFYLLVMALRWLVTGLVFIGFLSLILNVLKPTVKPIVFMLHLWHIINRNTSVQKPIIDVIIPAYNEEQSIGNVVRDIPRDFVRHIIVANNNSSDKTADVAEEAGAVVVYQPIPGYGNACLKGM